MDRTVILTNERNIFQMVRMEEWRYLENQVRGCVRIGPYFYRRSNFLEKIVFRIISIFKKEN